MTYTCGLAVPMCGTKIHLARRTGNRAVALCGQRIEARHDWSGRHPVPLCKRCAKAAGLPR
jgi:hypothetical protein